MQRWECDEIDTLVIIGNGFDMWQQINSSYFEFQKYYLQRRDDILRQLGIKKLMVTDYDGLERHLSPVELIYGDPFEANELEDSFWRTFEASLSKVHRNNSG